MSAPFRIERSVDTKTRSVDEGFRQYLDRLLKMIPGEVVGLFLIGKGFIPADAKNAGLVWFGICLLLVILVRVYGTKDQETHKPAQRAVVIISAIAFVIWVYSLGWPFASFGLYVPYIGSLAVLLWSFVVPMFYKGEEP